VLAPGGLFAFTVETHAGAGMILGATLRYAHAPGHVEEVLAQTGFVPLVLDPTSIRSEKGNPVASLVVVAGRN
jgi:predicted TPR repeat methyltransferase